jgi:serine/threonine-protein kinase
VLGCDEDRSLARGFVAVFHAFSLSTLVQGLAGGAARGGAARAVYVAVVRHPLLDVREIAEPVDAYLRRIGRVFRVFDRQDSECVSYGVELASERWFVKSPTTAESAVPLRRVIALHAAVQHSAIIPLRNAISAAGALVLVYPWVDGEVLYHATKPPRMSRAHPASAIARFRCEPTSVIERVLDDIIDAHLAVVRVGFVAVDFYDGCVIYDFGARRAALCDLDEYRLGPFVVEGDRLPGSRRFMAPEEHRRGARIDERTTVFVLGRAIRLLLDAGDDERAWRGTPAQLAVIAHATRADPADRYPTMEALAAAWHRART